MNRDISHWADWSDADLLDQAAGACQSPELIEDQVVREAVRLNVITPLRQALAKSRKRSDELCDALEYVMTAHGEQLTDAFELAQRVVAEARAAQ